MFWTEPTYAPSIAIGNREPNISRASQAAPVWVALRAASSMKPIAPAPTVASTPIRDGGRWDDGLVAGGMSAIGAYSGGTGAGGAAGTGAGAGGTSGVAVACGCGGGGVSAAASLGTSQTVTSTTRPSDPAGSGRSFASPWPNTMIR